MLCQDLQDGFLIFFGPENAGCLLFSSTEEEDCHASEADDLSGVRRFPRQKTGAGQFKGLPFRNQTLLFSRQAVCKIGKEIALKEEYQKKVDKNSLSKDEMADILKAYYKAFRIRDRMQMISLSDEQKQKMERSCFNTLSEYFEVIEK